MKTGVRSRYSSASASAVKWSTLISKAWLAWSRTACESADRVEGIIDQLRGITSEPVWDRGVLVRSAEDGVALALRQFMDGEYDYLLERMLGPRPTDANRAADAETQAVSQGDEAA